jgi:hypothetical protein
MNDEAVNLHAMKAYGEMEAQLRSFLHRHYVEVSGQLLAPAALPHIKILRYP